MVFSSYKISYLLLQLQHLASASKPIENECSFFLASRKFFAAEVNEESNPPDSNTPTGTSLIKRLRVASIKVLFNSKSNFDQPFHNLHRQVVIFNKTCFCV
jgi:hypothetical protein